MTHCIRPILLDEHIAAHPKGMSEGNCNFFLKDQGCFTCKLTSFNIDNVEEMEGLTAVELDPLYSAAV